MRGKRLIILGMFFLAVALMSFVSAQQNQVTYCAERTVDGAWCQNVPLDKVNQDYRYVPTSCDSTSYCKPGTCIDSGEGVCMERTPERVCTQENGVWRDADVNEVPQCQLGCCILGDEAAFVTQTRCKKLSSDNNLETNYRTDITSEAACIAAATSDVEGACVFDREFETTCRRTTRGECSGLEGNSQNSNVDFYEGLLCSNEDLATNCGMSEQTRVVEGKDEVFFVDTCGNLANIYDANRVDEQSYWDNIIGKAESCQLEYDNRGNPTNAEICGNCDYFAGSTGKRYDRGIDPEPPEYGDYICRNLNCEYDENNDGDIDGEETFKHGETWCTQPQGAESPNNPGGRYFRAVCYNGDVTVEPCADFRQETCIESSIPTEQGPFSTAACRVNKWQDCIAQDNEDDCENEDQRDCQWLGSEGKCVPEDAPGLNFWESGTDAGDICAKGNVECTVTLEKTFEGGNPITKTVNAVRSFFHGNDVGTSTDVEGSIECVDENGNVVQSWVQDVNNACINLGDCGVSVNYIDKTGDRELNDLYDKK